MSRTGVFDICKRVDAGGTTALDDVPRAARAGRLEATQQALLRGLIATQTPEQLSLPALLWTNPLVAQLVEQRTGLRLSVRHTALMLAGWGFKPPRPLAKARQRCAAAAERWLAEDYPGIVARARAEDAELGWVDESRLGDLPDRSVFSIVDSRGRMRWATYAGALDADMFVELLRRRIQHADRKTVLILDPLGVHRSASVATWLAEHEDDIALVHLPRERAVA